ncbi:MAG: DNA polymerase/3'-5' exonuclease PolX [Candidatus Omnitrophica bacterium]|nr:DNA polymerase/3'-5' exonuclease PolX [Candidatus Omnitrophota bacterium]
MVNKEIADIFHAIADILEIQGENAFRVRAYRRASQLLENTPENAAELLVAGKHLPGIGHDLAQKILEFSRTGSLGDYEKLKHAVPAGLLDIVRIPGVGPKRTKLFYDKLGIADIAALEQAAHNHRLRALAGIKDKTEEHILEGIALIRQGSGRILLAEADEIAAEIRQELSLVPGVRESAVAGSVRRRRETVHDIDILVAAARPPAVIDALPRLRACAEIIAQGPTKISLRTHRGFPVDIRVVVPECFGAALVYFTGSPAHNVRLRELAKRRGLKINEYGVFAEGREQPLAAASEEAVYQAVDLPWIAPELREDQGEMEQAAAGNLPRLITAADIRADTHVHSQWSDGRQSIRAMAQALQARGCEYMVIADHSQSLGIARGLKPDDLRRQMDEIRQLNKQLKNFRILCGAEVDITAGGNLDFEDTVLRELDVVLAAVHSGFRQPQEQLTQRIVHALEHPYVDILVHPTGRLLGERAGYALDFERILSAARRTHTALEINASPKRLDLDGAHCRLAKQAGVKLVIGTDSHDTAQCAHMELGVGIARRGGLEAADVLNCLPCEQFLQKLRT